MSLPPPLTWIPYGTSTGLLRWGRLLGLGLAIDWLLYLCPLIEESGQFLLVLPATAGFRRGDRSPFDGTVRSHSVDAR
jgi:hypothetical protein